LSYVGGLKFGQYGYFLNDIIDIIVGILNVHNFDSNRLTRSFVYPRGTP
jgi:hypothetical protein